MEQPRTIQQIDASGWLSREAWMEKDHDPEPSAWRIESAKDFIVRLRTKCKCGDSECEWHGISSFRSGSPGWSNWQPNWKSRGRAARDSGIELMGADPELIASWASFV